MSFFFKQYDIKKSVIVNSNNENTKLLRKSILETPHEFQKP